ncbi:MAG: ornithine cyclodeaminase family protein [Methylobacteriaceae bacterium]|nr:ornithine cyclodeaminase family protein [Methylobacteriaceae bacterium]
MLVLTEADVAALVRPAEAVALAAEAYRLAAGRAGATLRGTLVADDPRRGCLVLAGSAEPGSLTVKSNVHAYPDGPEAPRRWGSLLTLWDWRAARPRALLSAELFNEHRTAAGFAAAIDLLAEPEPEAAALFGAGKSAPLAAVYLRTVRPSLARLHLLGRSPERVAALARRLAGEEALAGTELVATSTPAEAVADSAVVVTVTTSDIPVFPGRAARPGSCVVLGGANRPTAREADDDLVRRADIVFDSRAGAFEKAGDLALARASGALDECRIRGEIGTFAAAPPLSPGADLRIFKSMGLALQDTLLAEALVGAAEARGLGTRLDLAGARVAKPS